MFLGLPEIILLVAYLTIPSVATGYIAKRRGRRFIHWLFIGAGLTAAAILVMSIVLAVGGKGTFMAILFFLVTFAAGPIRALLIKRKDPIPQATSPKQSAT